MGVQGIIYLVFRGLPFICGLGNYLFGVQEIIYLEFRGLGDYSFFGFQGIIYLVFRGLSIWSLEV